MIMEKKMIYLIIFFSLTILNKKKLIYLRTFFLILFLFYLNENIVLK